MSESVYLIQCESEGLYQITVPRQKPIEDWEYELIDALKASPDFLWLGNGKFIIHDSLLETKIKGEDE